MGEIEERLFDLEEYLRRNDDSADSSAYLTIVGIANEASKLESENTKLRELCEDMLSCIEICEAFRRPPTTEICKEFADCARELGVKVK